MHYIYKITNLVNQKVYVGQTKDTSKRWYQHKKESSKDKPRMVINQAMKKHGIENFTFEVIATCSDQEAANGDETIIVSQENSLVPNGYNVSLGGSNAPKSKEWIDMMKKYWSDPEWKENTIKSIKDNGGCFQMGHGAFAKSIEFNKSHFTGKNLSDDHRQKISNALKGTSFQRGRVNSDESKKKCSESMLKKHPFIKCFDDTCEKKALRFIDDNKYCNLHGQCLLRLRKK